MFLHYLSTTVDDFAKTHFILMALQEAQGNGKTHRGREIVISRCADCSNKEK